MPNISKGKAGICYRGAGYFRCAQDNTNAGIKEYVFNRQLARPSDKEAK